MTKYGVFILTVLSLSFTAVHESNAQFINLQIRIEPEITAKVEQNLNFGELVINSGEKFIGLGDLNMGVFSIRALHTQSVFLSMNTTEALVHTNPFLNDEIPINLNIAYNNTGDNNANHSVELTGDLVYLPIYNNLENPNPSTVWQELYLYVFGTIEVGEVATGEYFSELTLVVQYD
ncbi:MAG: hypothetical protein JJ971_13065 [Balneolaceae bacterium]|nr:hypothetical protein [Balneolaceae bacterium]MBO6547216.1 hypothetical protein [Balneolaceae bacterium]MBO6647837.1 hypothetical protein [Balneolaceae bacterium]